MKFLSSFFKRITDDLKQKKLIPLKILFFVHASTLFVLYPYLTIHMRELGINVEETAIMSAVTPVVSIVMPPLAGMLADKIGNFRLLLALSSALGGASALLLLAVPVGRLTVTFPPSAELLLRCEGDRLRLQHLQDYLCLPLHPYPYDVNLSLMSCGFLCDIPDDIFDDDAEAILRSHSYDIHMNLNKEKQFVYRHFISGRLLDTTVPKIDQSTSRIMTNNPYFNMSIAKVSDRQIFFPTPDLYQMDCLYSSNNATCALGKDGIFSEIEVNNDQQFRLRISQDADKSLDDIRSYLVEAISRGDGPNMNPEYDGVDSVTCKDNFPERVIDDNLTDGLGPFLLHVNGRQLGQCVTACSATVPRKSLCENQLQQVEIDPAFTFWAYLAVRMFIGVIGGTAFAMFEGAVIAILRDQRADYGLQRVYGSIGGMISSPLSGLLIDYASRGKAYTDFRPAFYLYSVLKVASGALMLSIDLEFKQPAQNLLEDVMTVLRNIEIVALFIACFIMGTAWGYIESFLFWLLQDLGASRSLMGITITVGGIAGLPLLVLSGPIIRRLGHANVLFIGFIFYAIRLLGYSLIYNPWLCLIFEALESVTSSLSFTAAVTYAARLSSTTTDTSVQGLLGGLYYGVGKGAGSLIGGYLMKAFGTRPTYQIFACATFITGCIYFLFNKFYLRKRVTGEGNDIYKKKPKISDVESNEIIEKEKEIKDISISHGEKKLNDNNIGIERIKSSLSNHEKKLVVDSMDGGSDSGVENPAYNENETPNERKMEKGKD